MLAVLQTARALAQGRNDQPIVGRIAAVVPDDAQSSGQQLDGIIVCDAHAGRHVFEQARIDFPRRLERIAGGDLKSGESRKRFTDQ